MGPPAYLARGTQNMFRRSSVVHASEVAETTIVDFTSVDSPLPLIFESRLRASGVTLVRCRTTPNPTGRRIVSPQTTIAVPAGPGFLLDWKPPDGEGVRSSTIRRGRVMMYAAGVPIWKRWQGAPTIVIMALAPEFIEAVREHGFEPSQNGTLPTMVGLDDPVAENFMRLAERELNEGGIRGRVFVEGLATALAAHVLQAYGGNKHIERRPGALAVHELKRVTDFVAARLPEALPVSELAALSGLSPHHFGDAFKAATGLSPHQYVIRCRVERAQELLRTGYLTPAQIAVAVGFSSQSHLTEHFQRLTGLTPARFRRLRA